VPNPISGRAAGGETVRVLVTAVIVAGSELVIDGGWTAQ